MRAAQAQLRVVRAGLLAFLSTACATPTPSALPLSLQQTFAWVARSDDPDDGDLLLYGSVHARRAPVQLPPEVDVHFERAEVIVAEIDPDEVGPLEGARLLQRYGTLDGDRRLRDVISPETWQGVQQWAERREVPVSRLSALQPWMVAMLIEIRELEANGFDPDYGDERRFVERARGEGKRIEELESAHEQFHRMSALSAEAQEQLLREAGVTDFGPRIAELDSVVASGDEAAMVAYLHRWEGHPGAAEFTEEIIHLRNDRMSERLRESIRDGRSRFVMVGLAHMVGERGIPAQLEAAGFAVHRLGAADSDETRTPRRSSPGATPLGLPFSSSSAPLTTAR